MAHEVVEGPFHVVVDTKPCWRVVRRPPPIARRPWCFQDFQNKHKLPLGTLNRSEVTDEWGPLVSTARLPQPVDAAWTPAYGQSAAPMDRSPLPRL
ncbi:hypothetical protein U9M48_008750 [Paspalum notatum var. saurae]|uniref:Uncharacterized protein n=1 Tax=Paspalum notatum var. saurae TaxID=547442 RepID=A0AAQ3SPW0_PASNO